MMRHLLRAGPLLAAALSLQAAPVPFSAQVSGQSDIVGVVDPAGPVVQVQTAASGSGSLGTLQYVSADRIDLGTGQGQGHNRFVADDGSELFGDFTVQLLPTADPALLALAGDVVFSGGSGRFADATGWATFTGSGHFISAVNALTQFDFRGVLDVPEPAMPVLALTALALALRTRRHSTAG
ncbi:MAG: hypothetical protein U1F56_17530 [Rubrivivax sp.]